MPSEGSAHLWERSGSRYYARSSSVDSSDPRFRGLGSDHSWAIRSWIPPRRACDGPGWRPCSPTNARCCIRPPGSTSTFSR